MTDVAIIDTLKTTAPVEIIWQPKVFLPFHPNGMTFAAFDANNKIQENWTVYSIGGGALAENNSNPTIESHEVYGMNSMTEILEWCERTGKSYWVSLNTAMAFSVCAYMEAICLHSFRRSVCFCSSVNACFSSSFFSLFTMSIRYGDGKMVINQYCRLICKPLPLQR